MSKVLILSHISDIDGMGSVVLAKIAFNDIDYLLFENHMDLEINFRNYLNDNYLDKYDSIYICDLSLLRPSIDIVNNDTNIKNKLKVFDHHQKAIEDGLDKYDFCTIIEEDDKKKRCGTELFYEYLCNNKLIKNNKASDDFVELTRLEDVWAWKEYGEFGIKAHDLSYLFSIIGVNKYIESMVKKIKDNNLSFNEEEQTLIDNMKSSLNSKMEELLNDAEFLIDENGNKFVTLFADYKYRNDITDYIESIYNDEYKYVIIVALDKGEYGQKSYRSIAKKFNVNNICSKYGGGGHPGAAAVRITKSQREYLLKLEKNKRLKYIVNCGCDNE